MQRQRYSIVPDRDPWIADDSASMTADALPRRWEHKALVQSLRREGFSYREILARVSFALSKSTISAWCKDIELTPEQLDRLDQCCREGSYRGRLVGSKAVQRRRADEIATIRAGAAAEVTERLRDPLWLAGLMLYWAEGEKKNVSFCNSDPRAVRFMMRWFREICQAPEHKFKAQLHIHSGQDDQLTKMFWSMVAGLPLAQFRKSYVKQEGTGHRKNSLYRGTIKIAICNRNLLHTIQGWIAGFNEQMIGPLAQSAEQGALNAKVEGSIPSRPTVFQL